MSLKFLEAFPGQSKKYDSLEPEQVLLRETLASHQELAEKLKLPPRRLFGNSYGLYAALVVAGAITAGVAYKIARDRAELVNKAEEARLNDPTRMWAVLGLNETQIINILDQINGADPAENLAITNINGPTAFVVSGPAGKLRIFKEALTETKLRHKAFELPINGAYHHPVRQPESKRYGRILEQTEIADPRIPLISSTKPRILQTIEDIREELTQQMVRPVDLPGAVGVWVREGIDTVVESGPGNVIQRLVRGINNQIRVLSFETDKSEIEKL